MRTIAAAPAQPPDFAASGADGLSVSVANEARHVEGKAGVSLKRDASAISGIKI